MEGTASVPVDIAQADPDGCFFLCCFTLLMLFFDSVLFLLPSFSSPPPSPSSSPVQMMDVLMGLFVATGGLFGLLSMVHTFALNAAGQKRMW